MNANTPKVSLFCRLDLGQSQQFTSLAVLEKTALNPGGDCFSNPFGYSCPPFRN